MALARKIQYLGEVDNGNSSIVPLDADEVFTGDSILSTGFSMIYVTIGTNVVSATDGLSIQQSADGITWEHEDTFSVPVGGDKFSIAVHALYLRVVYTNGGTNQGVFRLQTLLQPAGNILDVSPSKIVGGPVTIGTTAVELTFSGKTKVISIKSASTNTGIIWFGASNVTNTGANALGELTADSSVEIGLDDSITAIYAVSDTAAQTVYKAALV